MLIHKIKTHIRHFRDILHGAKTFEIRKNDRDYKVGDMLLLQEWDNGYTNTELLAKVTHVLYDYELVAIKSGYCVMSIKVILTQ